MVCTLGKSRGATRETDLVAGWRIEPRLSCAPRDGETNDLSHRHSVVKRVEDPNSETCLFHDLHRTALTRPDYKEAVAEKSQTGRGTEASAGDVPVDTDESLLARVRRGDREGLESLYRRHGPSLLALLTRMLDDHQMAEEVIQDTFVAVWNGAQFDGRSRVRTWLVAIAIRRAGSQRRKRRFPVGRQGRESASDDPTPEDIVVTGLDVDRLIKDLSELTQLQRQVVLLAFAEQLTHPEIAKVLGVRLGTVKSRLHGAKRALVRKWEQGDKE